MIVDLEKGLLNAMSQLFPQADERLCHFHMSKALFTNIQTKRLLPLYEDGDLRALMRCFGALAFLPVDEVTNGYNDLCSEIGKLIPEQIPEEYRDALDGRRKSKYKLYMLILQSMQITSLVPISAATAKTVVSCVLVMQSIRGTATNALCSVPLGRTTPSRAGMPTSTASSRKAAPCSHSFSSAFRRRKSTLGICG